MLTKRSPLLGHRLRFTLGCYALLAPAMLLVAVFVYWPVVWAFSKSLYQFEVGGEPRFIGLDNYREIFTGDPVMGPAFVNMMLFTLIAVIVRLTIPVLVAKLIFSLSSERGRYFYRILFLIPIVAPAVAVQLIWGGLVYSSQGLLNEFLGKLGLAAWAHEWLSEPQTALLAMAMIGFPFAGGFEILIYYAGLANIPQSVHEAALLEGCTGLRKFFMIDLPMLLSQLKLILILTLIGGIQGFWGLFVLTKGGPGFTTMVPGLWLYFNAFSFQRMGYACAIGVCLFVLIFTLTVINLRYFKSTEELEGVR